MLKTLVANGMRTTFQEIVEWTTVTLITETVAAVTLIIFSGKLKTHSIQSMRDWGVPSGVKIALSISISPTLS